MICFYCLFFFLVFFMVLLSSFSFRLEVCFHLLYSLFRCHSLLQVGSGLVLYLLHWRLSTFLHFFFRFFVDSIAVFVIHHEWLIIFYEWSTTSTVTCLFDYSCWLGPCPCYAVDNMIVTTQHLYDGVLLDESRTRSRCAFLFDHFTVPYYYTFVLWCWCK